MKLDLNLINCYGINQLTESFDFTKTDENYGVYSLYAPNGTLKTSLAKTFKDIIATRETKDIIFSNRDSNRDIKANGEPISKDQIMVIDSYDESYSSRQLSTLLVNNELKQTYDEALKEVDNKRSALIKGLAKTSGKQAKSVPELICSAFSRPEKELLELLVDLISQEHDDLTDLNTFKYGDLFNPKVLELASEDSFGQDLSDYVGTYEKIISESAILSKTFNHQKAGVISKSLSDTGFFTASHSVNLSIRGRKEEVTSREHLDEVIQNEQNKVFQNQELKEKFSKLDEKLTTKETQAFRDLVSEHQFLLPEYKDIQKFKQKIVIGYLQSHHSAWEDLTTTYQANQQIVKHIIDQAKQQETTWKRVTETFNKRFSVPFKLHVDNQDEVILNDAAPAIRFEFNDGRESRDHVSQQSLLAALSQGEKRALYILNVLFEIEVKATAGTPILIVIDDIADSFDYKNKYAIVEYLRDIAKIPHFNLLLLTHNFDFHRIIGSRIIGSKSNESRAKRLLASRTSTEIKLSKEKYQNDVFNAWKRDMHRNESYMLASIPFVRNLTEYCGHEENYKKLTSLLHIKEDTAKITVNDLQEIYRSVFSDKSNLILQNNAERVIDKIFQQSDHLSKLANESPDLECKVIVAMAIRLKAEDYMISKINDQAFLKSVQSNQTRELFDKYIELHPGNIEIIYLLDQVNLMTPENIHLNSFMYEPILDMSAHRLYELYNEVKQLAAE